jgi:hypothetical protein
MEEKIVKEIIEYLSEVRLGAMEEMHLISSDESYEDPESVVFLYGGISILGTCISYLEREYLGKA